ncbi:hypothetical protein ACWDCX_12830 [Streptomyces fungicidicus]
MTQVVGTSDTDDGVLGVGKAPGKAGVAGVNENNGNGIYGRGHNGLFGDGKNGNGTVGISANNDGVLGIASVSAKSGVAGVNDHGGNGLYGRGRVGVAGEGKTGNGVFGVSDTEDGVLGIGNISAKSGVAGVNDHGGNGLYGRGANGVFASSNVAGGKAGVFDGDVLVTGNLMTGGAGLHEMFDRIRQLEQYVADLQRTVAYLTTQSHPQGSG